MTVRTSNPSSFYVAKVRNHLAISIIDNGCGEISRVFEVFVDNTCCMASAPNIFTPNGDNKNDFFEISKGTKVAAASLEVANRWGLKVYETADLTNYWDGMSNGVEVSNGVYFWTITLTCDTNGKSTRQTLKGTITLQR